MPQWTKVFILLLVWAGNVGAQELTADGNTQLLLHFNNSWYGDSGESPRQLAGPTFDTGKFSQGAHLWSGDLLAYGGDGNITSSQGTLEFWLRPDWNGNDDQNHLVLTWGTWGGLLMGKDAGNYWRIIVNRWGPDGTPERGAGLNVAAEWQAGQWHHCAFTWSSEQVQVFIDGVLRSQEPVGFSLPSPGASDFQIGGEGTSDSLAGTLDELRLSDSVRSPAEIFESYANGLTITALAVAPNPVAIAAGWSVRPDITATAVGVPDLSVPPVSCTWTFDDPSVAEISAAGEIVGLQLGSTVGHATWHGAAADVAVEVQGALPAPANLLVTGFHTTAAVTWEPVSGDDLVGYVVDRRVPGDAFAEVKRVLARCSFTDSGLDPGQTYEYRVAGIDARGSRLTSLSNVAATTLQTTMDGLSRHKNLEILIAVYTDGYAANDLTRLTGGVLKAIEFTWRTSRGHLNFDPTFLYIEAPLPAPEWGAVVEADLRDRGVVDDQYDLAFLVGDGLSGCFSPFWVFGSTIAGQGTVCRVPYPEKIETVDYSMVWTFTHEIHHALEGMDYATGDDTPPVLFCHFPWDYPFPLGGTGEHLDWAAHYNGIAKTNRLYGDNWLTYPAPYDQVLECVDVDGDLLPDADPRVPIDESRFLSVAGLPDTDEDGLDDLQEFSRYDFRGTDPALPDTDGDGRLDGADHEPLYDVPATLAQLAAPPAIDGDLAGEWPVLAHGYYYNSSNIPFALTAYAGWTADGLYLAFETTARQRFMLSLDGSGEDGRFESPVRHVDGATDTDNEANKGNHIGDTWGDGNHIFFAQGDEGAGVYDRGPIAGAQVATTFTGGVYRTEVFLPTVLPGGAAYTWYPAGPGTPTTQGLTLENGRVIGLNVTMSHYDSADNSEFSGGWTSLFETHSYVDFTLSGPVAAVPDRSGELPRTTGLLEVSPNPFNPLTTIRFALATPADVCLSVYDLAGRLVATLSEGPREAGVHEVTFDGAHCASGVYLCRLQAGPFEGTMRMLLLK
jgi:hypothetical protein